MIVFTLNYIAISSFAINGSYSASLFEAFNPKQMECSTHSLFEFFNKMPAPDPLLLDEHYKSSKTQSDFVLLVFVVPKL